SLQERQINLEEGWMENKTVRVGVAQMCSGPDLAANLAEADRLIAQAQGESVELLVLPENFAVFGHENLPALAEPADGSGAISRFLAEAARSNKIWLVGGTAPYQTSRTGVTTPVGKVFPGCSVWSSEGECAARYDKCHLFDVD